MQIDGAEARQVRQVYRPGHQLVHEHGRFNATAQKNSDGIFTGAAKQAQTPEPRPVVVVVFTLAGAGGGSRR